MSKRVLVEIGAGGEPIRIFRTVKASLGCEHVREMDKATAVGSIRRQVFARADGQCEHCGNWITWKSMHMHENQAKGKRDENGDYGEVSVENCRALCYDCHLGRPDSAHGNRRWHTARIQK